MLSYLDSTLVGYYFTSQIIFICYISLGDEIRRVTMETVIPFVKALFVTRVAKKTSVKDAVFAEYEQFDDYLEMVIQFGVSYERNTRIP